MKEAKHVLIFISFIGCSAQIVAQQPQKVPQAAEWLATKINTYGLSTQNTAEVDYAETPFMAYSPPSRMVYARRCYTAAPEVFPKLDGFVIKIEPRCDDYATYYSEYSKERREDAIWMEDATYDPPDYFLVKYSDLDTLTFGMPQGKTREGLILRAKPRSIISGEERATSLFLIFNKELEANLIARMSKAVADLKKQFAVKEPY